MTATLQALPLRDYQRTAVEGVEAAWASGVRRPAVVLPTGGGKGHPLDTEVPTPLGLRRWGDLEIGDEVFGADGRPTRVTAIYDRGSLPTFRVGFKHGHGVVVDGDHLWAVQRKGRLSKVLSTRELAHLPLKDRDGWCWSVPVTVPVYRPAADLPLHPYVVGALIANGGMTHAGTVLVTPDAEVVTRVAEHVEVRERPIYESRTCPTYGLPGLTDVTTQLGLRLHSRDKRIPASYLCGSVEQRLDLLHGLMDGDGSSRAGGRRSVTYHTTSPELAEDVTELVTSLGGTCSVLRKDRANEGKPAEYACGILLPPGTAAFSTSRRDRAEVPRRRFTPREAITSITPTGRVEPIRCITVEAPDSLYLITRRHVVTHNTVVFAHLIARALAEGRRPIVLVHREELATQAAEKIRSVIPGVDVGIVKAERDEVDAAVVVASVQTLARPRRLERYLAATAGARRLVVVDEAHHYASRTWVEVLRALGCFAESDVRTVGFTATMSRTDGRGLGDVWETVVPGTPDVLDMIEAGYLVDPRGVAVTVEGLDLATVARSAGDYQGGQLGEALQDAGAGEAIARAYLEHATRDGRPRSGVLFAPTVATAHSFAADLTAAGVPAETITGETSGELRREMFDRHRTGATAVLCTPMVLTEGWDAPWCEVAVIARPTESPGLYVQMAGRVLRTWPGKAEALVLDVVGVTGRLALRSITDLTRTEVVPRDGESLAEAAARTAGEIEDAERKAAGRRPRKPLGAVTGEAVDLFHRSRSVWLQTYEGVWFIPTSDWTYFLWPQADGLWKVGRKPTWQLLKRNRRETGGWLQQDLDLGYAMAWGEADAEANDLGGASLSQRSASWRKRKAPPSEAQLAQLARRRIPVPETITKAEASDLISIDQASEDIHGRRLRPATTERNTG